MEEYNNKTIYNIYIYKNGYFINKLDIYKNSIIISSSLSGDVIVHGLNSKLVVDFKEKNVILSFLSNKKDLKYGSQFDIDNYSFKFNRTSVVNSEKQAKSINIENKKKNLNNIKFNIGLKWYGNVYILSIAFSILFFVLILSNFDDKSHIVYASEVEAKFDEIVVLQQSLKILESEYGGRLKIKIENDEVILKGFIETKNNLNEILLDLKSNLKLSLVNFEQVYTLTDLDNFLLEKMNLFGIEEEAYFQYIDDSFYLAGNFIGNQNDIINEVLKLIKIKFNIENIINTHIDNNEVILKGLDIEAVWNGKKPYLKLNNGIKYHLGSMLPSKWVLSAVKKDILIFDDNNGNKLSLRTGV